MFKISYILLNNSKCRTILYLTFLLLEEYTIVNIKVLQNIKKDRMSLFLNFSFSFRILIAFMFQIVIISIITVSRT